MNDESTCRDPDAVPSRDYVRCDAVTGGVCIETHEWDWRLRCYRAATALLTPEEAQRLARELLLTALTLENHDVG